jgi:hypothetical protein
MTRIPPGVPFVANKDGEPFTLAEKDGTRTVPMFKNWADAVLAADRLNAVEDGEDGWHASVYCDESPTIH